MQHHIDMGAGTVPAFLNKLWTLVEDKSTDELIHWDQNGLSFHVVDQARFAKEVLPLYFKHSNIASFIRQLNMYGFRKIMTIDHGGLKTERDGMQFQHPYFIRGKEHLLELIKRKVSTAGKHEDIKYPREDVSKVLVDVNLMKGKQDHIDSKLESLRRENEALWAEISELRQKHMKQQQVVNKLIQFLMTLVGSRGLSGMKRKMPLMINDSSHNSPKAPKYTRQLSFGAGKNSSDLIDVTMFKDEDNVPVVSIEEVENGNNSLGLDLNTDLQKIVSPLKDVDSGLKLGEEALDSHHTTENDPLISPPQVSLTDKEDSLDPDLDFNKFLASPKSVGNDKACSLPKQDLKTEVPDIQSCLETSLPLDLSDDEGNVPLPDSKLMNSPGKCRMDSPHLPYQHVVPASMPSQGALSANNSEKLLDKLYTFRDEISEQVDFMQTDLETLRDMLTSSPYFESSTMSGIFNGEQGTQEHLLEGLHHGMGQSSATCGRAGGPVGNEIVQYTPMDLPSLFEESQMDPTLSTLNTVNSSKDNLDTPSTGQMMDPLSEYMISNIGETKGLSTVTPSDDLD